MEQVPAAQIDAAGCEVAADTSDDGVSLRQIVLLSAWFGLAAGLLELLLLAIRVQISEKGFFLRSKHFVWMVPVSDLAIYVVAGLFVCVLPLLGRRVPFRWLVGLLIFLASLSQLLLVRGIYSWASVLFSAGVAVQVSRLVAARPARLWWFVRRTRPVLAIFLIVLVAWPFVREGYARVRSGGKKSAPARGAPNVLLIVLDTVRADHLSLFGHSRETSPHLARLAQAGVRFDLARATAPWTLPSHASLFTGRWPHELGVEKRGWLDDAYPTLAEHLGARGYDTAGFVANTFFCGHESGLSRGFETYNDYPVTPLGVLRSSSLGWLATLTASRIRGELSSFVSGDPAQAIVLDFERKDAARVNREFLEWLGPNRQAPFFAFLNFFDAHDPYIVPTGTTSGPQNPTLSRSELVMLRDWQKLNKTSLGAAQIALARRSYDDCITSLDRELGRLVDELKRRRVYEQTILIVTADHGEQFGEHGEFGHGLSLYQSEIHVPLLIVYPENVPAGKVVEQAVSLRDLPATVLDLIDQKQGTPFPGQSLVSSWREPGPDSSRSVAAPLSELEAQIEKAQAEARSAAFLGPMHAIVAGRDVYIRHGGGGEELYNLGSDPAETIDLASKEDAKPKLARCRQILDQLLGHAQDGSR